MSKAIDQKKYLQKYLSSDDKLQKKKKKKSKDKKIKATVKIIDDDAYAHYQDNEIDESDLYATNEEAPQIIGIIDERAPNVILKQEYVESGKWKALNSNKSDRSKESTGGSSKRIDSPLRKKLKKEDSDESPQRKKDSFDDSSPPRRKDFFKDSSPPHRRKLREDSDESPQRRKEDSSPPRRRKLKEDSDESPQRRKEDSSPPRRRSFNKSYDSSNYRRHSRSPPNHTTKMTKTLDGKRSGLQNAKDLKRENDEFRKRQDKVFKQMGSDVSGRNAEVVIRDRKGRNKELAEDSEKERKKAEAYEERKREYTRWGQGLKQVEQIEKRREEYIHEANKPLARFEDDQDLQDHLKNRELADDPMLEYMRQKKREERRKKGELEKPKYQGEFADNRYNIPPGHRWDGVDRSNGYEKKYFSMINSKKSIQEEAYRYSTEDM